MMAHHASHNSTSTSFVPMTSTTSSGFVPVGTNTTNSSAASLSYEQSVQKAQKEREEHQMEVELPSYEQAMADFYEPDDEERTEEQLNQRFPMYDSHLKYYKENGGKWKFMGGPSMFVEMLEVNYDSCYMNRCVKTLMLWWYRAILGSNVVISVLLLFGIIEETPLVVFFNNYLAMLTMNMMVSVMQQCFHQIDQNLKPLNVHTTKMYIHKVRLNDFRGYIKWWHICPRKRFRLILLVGWIVYVLSSQSWMPPIVITYMIEAYEDYAMYLVSGGSFFEHFVRFITIGFIGKY